MEKALVEIVKINLPIMTLMCILIILLICFILTIYLITELLKKIKNKNDEKAYDLCYKTIICLTLTSTILFFIFNCLQDLAESDVFKTIYHFLIVLFLIILLFNFINWIIKRIQFRQ